MPKSSTAYVVCETGGKDCTWRFTGVTAIEHTLALNLDSRASQGADIANGAGNLPDRVTLSVIETDAEHPAGWAARMLEAMGIVKKQRYLCRVATSMGTYENMLLTEIIATQDEGNQCGWSGTLAFTEYLPASEENAGDVKTNTNSSVRKNTGSAGGLTRISGSPFIQLLQRAGV